MRDLYKILQLCASEEAMDYCPEFDGVKAIFEYCDKNVKPFKKLCFRSGNDVVVNDLVRRLQQYFVERHLIDAESKKPLPGKSMQTLRKILVFMLANTDATYKYNLHDDINIAHIYEICPLLPKFLTVSLVWELQLEQFFFEALAYAPCWFSFQFFEAANESLKFVDDPQKILELLEEILKAMLVNMERSVYVKMDTIDQKIIFSKMHDQALILLRRFNTPDAYKIERMKKVQQERFWGYTLKHLLQMVLFAFDLYESKINTEPKLDISIYKIGENFQKLQFTTDKNHNQAIMEEQHKIINALLGTLQNCVMTLKMTTFIEWAEVDLTPKLTLQQSIGELAYKVRQRITENKTFEHGVHSILATIEIRPKTFEEIVTAANVGDILRALDNNDDDANSISYEQKKIWFNELFKRGTVVLDNDECLDTIQENLKLITPNNCIQIMDCIKLKISMNIDSDDDDNGGDEDDENDNDALIGLLLTALKQFSTKDLLELFDYRLNSFEIDSKALLRNTQIFEQRVIEFLNKLTTTFDLHEFLLLCFEDPLQLWLKFFISACQTEEHAQIFSGIVQKTLPASFGFVDKILKEAFSNQTQFVYFPKVLSELYFLLYRADKGDFLARFLNGHIKSFLEAGNYESLLSILKALEIIVTHDENQNFDELTAPMLAVIAFVAELTRWNLTTFEHVRVQIVIVSLNIIKETLDRFIPTITEKDRKWLTSNIKTTCTEITQYYFQRVFITNNENLKTFDIFLFGDKELNESNIVKFLKKTIIRCTAKEFTELLANKSFRKHLPIVLLQIANNIKNNSNTNAEQNVYYCLTSFLNFVNTVVDNDFKNWSLLLLILKLIDATPKDYYEQIFMESECLLKQLLELCSSSNNDNAAELREIKEFAESMPDGAAKNIFLQLKEFDVDKL